MKKPLLILVECCSLTRHQICVVNKQKSYLLNTALLRTTMDRVCTSFSENAMDSISNFLRLNET